MAALLSTTRAPRRVLALLAVALLAAAGVVAGARAAVSASPLPEVGADALLASVGDALDQPPPVTGEIATSLELGLPDLSVPGEDGGGGGLSALAGDQRIRLWRSADGFRIARLEEASEQALVTNGDEAWIWDSAEFRAERIAVPEGAARHDGDQAFEHRTGDPVALAAEALAAIDGSTEVTVDRAGRVAGRDTYRLVLTPRTAETLIGRVEIDVDGEQRLPLRTAVFAREAAAPSLELAYTTVSFDPVDPATFDFTPPPGAEVTERPAPEDGTRTDLPAFGDVDRPDVRTFGDGWATVVALPRPARDNAELDALLPFAGPLFSATTVEVDGKDWVLFGFVGTETLDRAAADLR